MVVAASAGGLIPLRRFLSLLPADLPASILVVLHIPATGGRALPRILDRSGPLAASVPADGEKLAHGRVFVAPPDRHVLVVNGAVRLSRGPRQNGVRPAADPLFRSAARYGGPRTVAVVLSGTPDDAALGSAVVEQCGGRVLVQDPEEAAWPGIPTAASSALTAVARCISAGRTTPRPTTAWSVTAGHHKACSKGSRSRWNGRCGWPSAVWTNGPG